MCVFVDCEGLPKTRVLDNKHMWCGAPAPAPSGTVAVDKLMQVQAAEGAGDWKEAALRVKASAKRLEKFDKTALVMVNGSFKEKQQGGMTREGCCK